MTTKKVTPTKRGAATPTDDLDEAEERLRGARLTNALFAHAHVPPFVQEAVRRAVTEAAEHFGIDLCASGEAFDADNLARLYDVAVCHYQPRAGLAELVSAGLKHPDTPGDLYNAVAEVVADMTSPRAVNESPEVIAVALRIHAEYEASREGGAK